MDYKIVERSQFTITGFTQDFTAADAFLKIPAYMNTMTTHINENKLPIGDLAVTINDEQDFNTIHFYLASEGKKDIAGCSSYTFPDGLWLQFPCYGAYPYALQQLAYEVYNNFLPSHPEFSIRFDASIDYLSAGDRKSPDYYSEFWLPIEKRSD